MDDDQYSRNELTPDRKNSDLPQQVTPQGLSEIGEVANTAERPTNNQQLSSGNATTDIAHVSTAIGKYSIPLERYPTENEKSAAVKPPLQTAYKSNPEAHKKPNKSQLIDADERETL